jgi:hypothetical protein
VRYFRLLCGRSSLSVATPESDLPPGVEEIQEPADPQALLAKRTVEALDVRVLGWLAGLDVHQLDLLLNAPRPEVVIG